MKLSSKVLHLVANPFAAPLASGRACALVPTDPTEPSSAAYLGARLKNVRVKRPGNVFGDRSHAQVNYDLAPRPFPDTAYYRAKLASGEVFAADGALDKLAGAAMAALAEAGLAAGDVAKTWTDQGLGVVVAKLAPVEPNNNAGAEPEGDVS